MNRTSFSILWDGRSVEGKVTVRYGGDAQLEISEGNGTICGAQFSLEPGPTRLDITVADARIGPGPEQTLLWVQTEEPFSFFLRDVRHTPFVPACGVVVIPADDSRSYRDVETDVRSSALQTALQRMESEPETTYAQAAAEARVLRCPTWLGLSRDMRIFQFDLRRQGEMWDSVLPRFHGTPVRIPEGGEKEMRYGFLLGRGWGCVEDMSRRLEDGALPILHGCVRDGEIDYRFTTFATLEKQVLELRNLRGTHFLVADGHGGGHMFTEEQAEEFEKLLPREMEREEETVLCFRARAVNSGRAPRYAWLHALAPLPIPQEEWSIDDGGLSLLHETGRVFAVQKLDGEPMPHKEVAILLAPGESATFEFYLPHRPISRERAKALADFDFDQKHAECRTYWQEKMRSGASIRLPEQRIDEMVRAGLTHLDIVAYGLEPDDPVTACIGVYCPIGSESSPIIQFMDSMGRHDLARRALEYFLAKQHEDGFIQNFGNYMLETGPALWSMGEHYRYTRDDDWVRRIAPKLIKACDYMIQWRRRSMKPECRGYGYGLQAGKVGDPPDPYRIFMLNGYAWLGMSRVAEMLATVNPAEAERLTEEASAFKQDILTALYDTMARSPVVPLGDGTWVPSCAPWAEYSGPVSLFAEGGLWYTHGTFTARDTLVGPLYLVFQEILTPNEPAAEHLLNWHTELMCLRNVAFSQPYYARQAVVNLMRGEVKAFLRAYYYGFAGLADRETYSFWEHYFHASPHKTHEEGWFLMQTRWMLWMEQGTTLKLLSGIPRVWLQQAESVTLEGVATYFGALSLTVESDIDHGTIRARLSCPGERGPEAVTIRLPHPHGMTAADVSATVDGREVACQYDADAETVRVPGFEGEVDVRLDF